MQLLDRYLTAVKFWLPKKQRADIAAELAANLQSEIDDRAAALGRPLSDDEVAAFLKQQGSPILVASRYQEEHRTVTFGRQLIGPIVFPFYWIALKVTLVLLLVPGIIPAVVLGSQREGRIGPALGNALRDVAAISMPTLLLLTLGFAAFDLALRKFHLLERWSSNWDPRQLPAPARQLRQVPRANSIAGIIIQSIFILWWLGHSSIPLLTIGNEGAQMHFAPVWASLHLPILIVAFICLAQHWINLVEPRWHWLPPVTGLVSSILGLVILYPLLRSAGLMTMTSANGAFNGQDTARLQQILSLSLVSLWIGILLAGAIYAWRLVWLAWQSMPGAAAARRSNGIAHT